MIGLFLRWIINTVALLLVVEIIPGIRVDRFETAAIVALVLGLLNAFIRPVLVLLTLPLQIMSLGLFTFIINGLLFYGVSKIVEGFFIANFMTAVIGALLFSIFSFALNYLIDPKGKISVRFQGSPPSRKHSRDNVIDVEGHTKDK